MAPQLQDHVVALETPPEAKRPKIAPPATNDTVDASTKQELDTSLCQFLLQGTCSQPLPQLPVGLQGPAGPVRNDLTKLRTILKERGLKTSLVSSPRQALSIYCESLTVDNDEHDDHDRAYLATLFGLHPQQEELETVYAKTIQKPYCLLLFCHVLQSTTTDDETDEFYRFLQTQMTDCWATRSNNDAAAAAATDFEVRVANVMAAALQADPTLRREQLQHEYDRIRICASSLSNALLQVFCEYHGTDIKEIHYKASPDAPEYARFTVTVYNPDTDLLKPPRFTFLPALSMALREGPENMAAHMVSRVWVHLLRRGYVVTPALAAALQPHLEPYLLAGLLAGADASRPLLLNAHFTPTYPLSLYLYGKAGAGKSSLARNLPAALNDAIEEIVDPELLVRFVKQNLNKSMEALRLELELRPNNNDLSVMSIVQGRRMTMGQSKPGLVVVGLEEMAQHAVHHPLDPNQLETAQLLTQRFSGRNSEYQAGKAAPRNSAKRGMSGDASIVPVFTSNYDLDPACANILKSLDMFENLAVIEMQAVSGKERAQFARDYLFNGLEELVGRSLQQQQVQMDLDLPLANDNPHLDTRELVRHLRMLAFYLYQLGGDQWKSNAGAAACISLSVVQDKDQQTTTLTVGKASMTLRIEPTMKNVIPLVPKAFDPRSQVVVDHVKVAKSSVDTQHLSAILDFWLARTLQPAVIVSDDPKAIRAMMQALQGTNIPTVPSIDAATHKIMKSLYDPPEMPNLREDLLAYKGSSVAVELVCDSTDAQMRIRELIEDTPSMTAFSTERSALHKAGLLFLVQVRPNELTPEIRSRASMIL